MATNKGCSLRYGYVALHSWLRDSKVFFHTIVCGKLFFKRSSLVMSHCGRVAVKFRMFACLSLQDQHFEIKSTNYLIIFCIVDYTPQLG